MMYIEREIYDRQHGKISKVLPPAGIFQPDAPVKIGDIPDALAADIIEQQAFAEKYREEHPDRETSVVLLPNNRFNRRKFGRHKPENKGRVVKMR